MPIRCASLNVALLGRAPDRLGAVAGGAYMTGELRGGLDNSQAWDYRFKKCGVAAQGLCAPTHWSGERLWGEVERREKTEDAIFGRRFILDLPHQISHEARVVLLTDFAEELRREYGVAVEWALHLPPRTGNGRN